MRNALLSGLLTSSLALKHELQNHAHACTTVWVQCKSHKFSLNFLLEVSSWTSDMLSCSRSKADCVAAGAHQSCHHWRLSKWQQQEFAVVDVWGKWGAARSGAGYHHHCCYCGAFILVNTGEVNVTIQAAVGDRWGFLKCQGSIIIIMQTNDFIIGPDLTRSACKTKLQEMVFVIHSMCLNVITDVIKTLLAFSCIKEPK